MIILAPMQGLTELLFRSAYEKVFPGMIDYSISPFLSLTHGNLKDADKKIIDVDPILNQGSIPVVPQILGKEIPEFIELANRLHEVGYKEVNWNIGCPVRRVTHKHRGSGILPFPQEIEEILSGVVPNIKPSLSIKMRLGFKSKDEIFDIIPILNRYPLSSVTIHPRIGMQQYTGHPDIDTFEKALPLIRHKVIYNGDIVSMREYRMLKARFPGLDDIMIGRGVLYNPTLPVQIKLHESGLLSGYNPQDDPRVKEFILTLMDAISQRPVPPVSKMRKLKEYWCLLFKSLGITEMKSKEVLHAASFEDTRDLILEIMK